MNESEELKNKVEKWINSEGIPLEYFTSSCFMNSGFKVLQSDFVEENGIPREIDVNASLDFQLSETLLRIQCTIECKWTKDKPWIVFTSSTANMAESANIAQTLGNKVGSSLLWHIAGEADLNALDLFSRKQSSGFSGRQALTKDSDLFYSTTQAITNKTILKLNEYDRFMSNDPFGLVAIGFPIIVIDGVLFESHFKNGKVEIVQVNNSIIHWRGSSKWKLHTTINIVTKTHLLEWVKKFRQELDLIIKTSMPALENLKSVYNERNSRLLNHKHAPRGYVGLPPFLNEILKNFES